MAKQCHRALQEACSVAVLPFRTIARWVAAFRDGRKHVEHMPRSGHHQVDKNLTICQLEQVTILAHSTVLYILKDLLKMRKIASKWVPHELTDTNMTSIFIYHHLEQLLI
ncbi:hypothetical protein C0J52_06146 [Blattella germanica]|nr:hypothetical protein C0J52_06146 [Blattella germanica]